MFMDKIRLILGGIGMAIMAVVYAIAYTRGKSREQVAQARKDADREQARAEFHRRMGEQQVDAPRNKDELLDRIRDKGL